jgi:hypothetical protein
VSSYANRLKKGRAAYKKASANRFPRITDGEQQMEIVSAQIDEPSEGYFAGCLVVKVKLRCAVGPDKGIYGPQKTYTILDSDDKPDEKGMQWFKADLSSLGLDPEFDLTNLAKTLKEMVGLVAECNIVSKEAANGNTYQNCWINGVTDALDDEDEEEIEEEEETEEEEEEEEEKPKPAKKAAKKASKKKASKKKAAKKPAKKAEPEPEEEEEEEEEDWDDDLDTESSDEDWEEDDEDEDWEE